MSKKLIVNADDFGRTPGVSEGILRACKEGIVTSLTAMMNMAGAATALQRASEECPRVGLGVHLVFTSGRPLIMPEWVSSLVDSHGYFLSQDAIGADPDRIDLGELKAELKAQIKTFQNATGHMPDHVDMHHFTHLQPRFFELYLELAHENQMPARLPFPRDETELALHAPTGLPIPPQELEAMIRANWELLKKYPVRSTDYFQGSFFGEQALTTHLLHILDSLPNGTTELLTHPGLADEKLLKQSRYAAQREKELSILCDPAVKQHVADLNIQLVTFADLEAKPAA